MNTADFLKKIKRIASLPTKYYSVSGGDWAKWTGSYWNFDCVILIKAILWGWNENKNASHGGAIYGSNGVKDDSTEELIKRCTNVSNDFNNLVPGELVYLPGHVGIYIGDGKVIEATSDYENKVIKTNIDSNGNRTYKGKQILRWQKHGKLPYINYGIKLEGHIQDIGWVKAENIVGTTGQNKRLEAIKIDTPFEVSAKAHIENIGWKDYGKINKDTIIGTTGEGKRLEAICLKGSFEYRVHIANFGWSPWTLADGTVTQGTTGQAKAIEAIEFRY